MGRRITEEEIKKWLIEEFDEIYNRYKDKFHHLQDCEVIEYVYNEIFNYRAAYLYIIRYIAEETKLYDKKVIRNKFCQICYGALKESTCWSYNKKDFGLIFDEMWKSNDNCKLREKVWEYRPWFHRIPIKTKFIVLCFIVVAIIHSIATDLILGYDVHEDIHNFLLLGPAFILAIAFTVCGLIDKISILPLVFSFLYVISYLYFTVFPVFPIYQVINMGKCVLVDVLLSLLFIPTCYFVGMYFNEQKKAKSKNIKIIGEEW